MEYKGYSTVRYKAGTLHPKTNERNLDKKPFTKGKNHKGSHKTQGGNTL